MAYFPNCFLYDFASLKTLIMKKDKTENDTLIVYSRGSFLSFNNSVLSLLLRANERHVCLFSLRWQGDVVSQWLVRQTWDLKAENSSPGYVVFLGKTLSVSLSTQVYVDNLTKYWQPTCDELVSHPGGVEVLLLALLIGDNAVVVSSSAVFPHGPYRVSKRNSDACRLRIKCCVLESCCSFYRNIPDGQQLHTTETGVKRQPDGPSGSPNHDWGRLYLT